MLPRSLDLEYSLCMRAVLGVSEHEIKSLSMAANTSSTLSITCAENIALLHFLHSVPALPSPNPAAKSPIPRERYSLSFEQERSLADTLAFLSSTKDDPGYIPAVCVEEEPESTLTNVLLAVNKVAQCDGNEILESVRQSFDALFAVLSQVSDGEWYIFILIIY